MQSVKEKTTHIWLFLGASLLLFTFLGVKDIWTQEHRWADIVMGMFYRHDFFHPYLGDVDYYDKPLLSYWLIAIISFITGHVSTWSLRLPSALAGLLSVWSIYQIGTQLKDKRLGLLTGWMLVTTFYFIFWARTSSADMLNMAGALFAFAWYFQKKSSPSFLNYSIFFLTVALASLCKGLIAAAVTFLAVLPDLLRQQEWKKHMRWSLFFGMIPAAIVYVLPFLISSSVGGNSYGENGLYEVYRENILRYFQPFDHKGPIYTYFIFLPLYLIPWTLFFIPAIFSLKDRWKTMSWNSKWLVWAVFLLFMFLTLSGSRRNYYVLPLVPFAILMTADWIFMTHRRLQWASVVGSLAFIALFCNFIVFQPTYYSYNSVDGFAKRLRNEVSQIQPGKQWHYVLLDPESKVRFYLELPPNTQIHSIPGTERSHQTAESLKKAWPILENPPRDVIIVSRDIYYPILKNILVGYRVVDARNGFFMQSINSPIAFIPSN